MKSPGLAERFSLSKLFVVLLSLIFVLLIGSCTQEQSSEQIAQLPTDQEITDTIRSQMTATNAVPDSSINITTKNGIVTLKGNTTNLLAKREAKKIAQSTYGVLAVVNNLKITANRPDDAVDQDVDRALANNPVTETWEITADANNGIVSLTGRADSWQERQLAGTVVSRVKGVKGINNNIIVNYDQSRNDEEIRAEVEQKLKMDAQVKSNMVDVNVEEGNVTLTGAIGSSYEKSLVKDLARVTGVESVNVDELEVHPEYDNAMFQNNAIETLTTDEIKNAINSALQYDPRVPEQKISVSIDGSTAILEGSVLNLNSKLAAGSDALNTAGISQVENNIEVQRKVVVKPKVPTTDEALTKRLKYSIMRDPYVEKTTVNVKVNDGFAILNGEVDSQFEKEQLNQIARNVKGIIAIKNNVTVKTGG